jgi:hypothetical protein
MYDPLHRDHVSQLIGPQFLERVQTRGDGRSRDRFDRRVLNSRQRLLDGRRALGQRHPRGHWVGGDSREVSVTATSPCPLASRGILSSRKKSQPICGVSPLSASNSGSLCTSGCDGGSHSLRRRAIVASTTLSTRDI